MEVTKEEKAVKTTEYVVRFSEEEIQQLHDWVGGYPMPRFVHKNGVSVTVDNNRNVGNVTTFIYKLIKECGKGWYCLTEEDYKYK